MDPAVIDDVVIAKGGDASADEVAAMIAAIEIAWPRPHAPQTQDEPSRWRFSGRWWSKPVPLRRVRPIVTSRRSY